jgi:hypothetical protein
LFKRVVIERFDELLDSILFLMSDEGEEVTRASVEVNEMLMEAIEKVNK